MAEINTPTDQALVDEPLLRWFKYDHLAEPLKLTSTVFTSVAYELVETLPRSAERTVALRKLLEAKDAAVRCRVAQTPGL